MSFSGTYSENIRATIDSAHGLVTSEAPLTKAIKSSFASANAYFSKASALSSVTASFDFRGSLEDDLGDTITLQKVYLVHFKNASTVASGSSMVVGSATTHIPLFKASANAITVTPQRSFTILDDTGISVTAATADTINIFGTSGDDYELVVIGRRTA